MLQHSQLDTFSSSESFRDSSILILDIFVDNSLHSLDLIQSVVKSDNLSNELSSLWNK